MPEGSSVVPVPVKRRGQVHVTSHVTCYDVVQYRAPVPNWRCVERFVEVWAARGIIQFTIICLVLLQLHLLLRSWLILVWIVGKRLLGAEPAAALV